MTPITREFLDSQSATGEDPLFKLEADKSEPAMEQDEMRAAYAANVVINVSDIDKYPRYADGFEDFKAGAQWQATRQAVEVDTGKLHAEAILAVEKWVSAEYASTKSMCAGGPTHEAKLVKAETVARSAIWALAESVKSRQAAQSDLHAKVMALRLTGLQDDFSAEGMAAKKAFNIARNAAAELVANAAPVQTEVVPLDIAKTLRTAFNLGQTYWQQADSEYTSQHKKADETTARFQQLVADTVAAINSGAALC